MKEKRYYQRYNTTNVEDNDYIPSEIKIDGMFVRLRDFSLGGVCFLSEESYAQRDIVTISVNIKNRGEIDLIGKVIRVTQAGSSWFVAIDLSHSHKLNIIRS